MKVFETRNFVQISQTRPPVAKMNHSMGCYIQLTAFGCQLNNENEK
jgi:hypothetical protein